MGKPERKTYKVKLDFKEDGEPGEFEAVFATLNVIDHDGDVTLPGAFGEQQVILEPWNHQWDRPPVGKGRIFERGNEAIVEGRFFLDTPSGKEHYLVAKELADMQEFSYTFDIIDAEFGKFDGKNVRFLKKMDVWGVGQVTRGAGIATRINHIKSAGNGDSDPGDDEGEAGDGKLSGVGPDVYRSLIDIIELDLED
jgi:hypothetical protein